MVFFAEGHKLLTDDDLKIGGRNLIDTSRQFTISLSNCSFLASSANLFIELPLDTIAKKDDTFSVTGKIISPSNSLTRMSLWEHNPDGLFDEIGDNDQAPFGDGRTQVFKVNKESNNPVIIIWAVVNKDTTLSDVIVQRGNFNTAWMPATDGLSYKSDLDDIKKQIADLKSKVGG